MFTGRVAWFADDVPDEWTREGGKVAESPSAIAVSLLFASDPKHEAVTQLIERIGDALVFHPRWISDSVAKKEVQRLSLYILPPSDLPPSAVGEFDRFSFAKTDISSPRNQLQAHPQQSVASSESEEEDGEEESTIWEGETLHGEDVFVNHRLCDVPVKPLHELVPYPPPALLWIVGRAAEPPRKDVPSASSKRAEQILKQQRYRLESTDDDIGVEQAIHEMRDLDMDNKDLSPERPSQKTPPSAKQRRASSVQKSPSRAKPRRPSTGKSPSGSSKSYRRRFGALAARKNARPNGSHSEEVRLVWSSKDDTLLRRALSSRHSSMMSSMLQASEDARDALLKQIPGKTPSACRERAAALGLL